MMTFNNVNVEYNDIEDLIKYMEKNLIYPTIVITELPKVNKSFSKLNKLPTVTDILNDIENKGKYELLDRFYNLCNDNCHIYIITGERKLLKDMSVMEEVGFVFNKLLVYEKESINNDKKNFKDNTGFILF